MHSVQIDLKKLILDANFVYTEALPAIISLTGIEATTTDLIISVGTKQFTLENPPSELTAYPAYLYNQDGSLLVIGIEAYKLFTAMLTGETYTPVAAFEPSVATEISGLTAGVNSVSFADEAITAGDITLNNGYQTGIQFIGQVIQLTVGRNFGQVLDCTRFFEDEEDDCDSVISNINGATPKVSGGSIYLVAGPHVKIFDDPERARIYIGLDFGDNSTCVIPSLPPAP